MARGKEASHRGLSRIPVRLERPQVEVTLVAESIVKALSSDLHGRHEIVQRRLFKAIAPEHLHRRRQGGARIELFGPGHCFGLYSPHRWPSSAWSSKRLKRE